ncbi:MAG: AAA family ATPase, partial [Burkholderiaceae bacterium]
PAREITHHEGGISKLRALADQEQPDAIIVEGLCRDTGELASIEFVTTIYPSMMIIMLCSQQSSDFLIHAMRVGVREVLPSPPSADALEAAVARVEAKLGLRGVQRSARILAFMPAKGGSGATFLAANLAHQLAAEGKRALLLDLNLQFGEALMTVHDRKASSDIAEIARNLSRLDASFLASSTVEVAPNFAVLAAPEDPGQALQVKPEHLDAILNLAATQFDFIILDVSRNLDDLTIKALDRAHQVFLVLQMALPFVRNANRMMGVFRSLGYPPNKVELVVNRFGRNGEIGLDDVRASLGVHQMRTIPNSYKEVVKAINQGVPLSSISRSSPVFKAIGELVESLLPKADELQGGLLSRLLKR